MLNRELPANTGRIGLKSERQLKAELVDAGFERQQKYVPRQCSSCVVLVVVRQRREFNERLLAGLRIYAAGAGSGANRLCLCAAEDINTQQKTICGYAWQADGWHWQDFSWPAVFFLRVRVAAELQSALLDDAGCRVFNEQGFDKWDFWRIISGDSDLRAYLPPTWLLDSMTVLHWLLQRFDHLIFKPVQGSLAAGIVVLRRRTVNCWELIFPLQPTGNSYLPLLFDDPEEIGKLRRRLQTEKYIVWHHKAVSRDEVLRLAERLRSYNYLIQQVVDLPVYEQRLIDWRVIMQKDETGCWQCSGLIARLGKRGSVITNFTAEGYALTVESALRQIYHLSQQEAVQLQEQISEICRRACLLIEKSGWRIADVGFDVAIDHELKIWLLEVNMLHYHTFPMLALKDQGMFELVTGRPVRYALMLAEKV